MIKRKERAPLNDLDVGPFSDISFLLIIFFILTTQILSMTGIVLSIPAGAPTNEAENKNEDKQIMISLSPEMITLRLADGEEHMILPAEIAELKALLLAQDLEHKDVNEKLIVIECESKVKYELYYKVITIIQNAGGLLALVEPEDSQQEGEE